MALGYKPREIDQLQPHEIETIYKAAQLREEMENRRAAYFTAWLIAPHVKRGKVDMQKILKPLLPKKKKTQSELREEQELLRKALGNG